MAIKSSPETGQQPRKTSHRGIAPEIRRLALKHPELTHSDIARRVDCNPANVTGVLKTFLGKRSPADLQEFQANQADIVDSLKMRVVESISQKKLEKSSALQLTTIFGILYDKGALLRGQPTGINATILFDVVEAIKARDA